MTDGRGKAVSPAWGHGRLPPLRDPLHELSGMASMHLPPEGRAVIQSGSKVLEIGCGTGNLGLLVRRLRADAWVAGPLRHEGARPRSFRERHRVVDAEPGSFGGRSTGCR